MLSIQYLRDSISTLGSCVLHPTRYVNLVGRALGTPNGGYCRSFFPPQQAHSATFLFATFNGPKALTIFMAKLCQFFVGLILVITASSMLHAASFDCSRAASKTELLICQNPELSALDTDLAVIFKDASKFEGVREGQVAWIKERDRCESVDCLVDSYENRIDSLKGYLTGDFEHRLASPEASASSEGAPIKEKAVPDETSDKPVPVDTPASSEKPKASPESNAKEQSDGPKSGDSDLVGPLVILGVLFLLIYGTYRFIRFLIKSGKNMLAQSAIRKKYEGLAQIDGTVNDESLYVSAHHKALDITQEKLQRSEVFFLGIPFSDVSSTNFANWTALRGELDDPSYNNAMQTYQLAKQQYDMAKDQARRANQSFYQSSPDKPSRSDFVRYYPASGTASVPCSHGIIQLIRAANVRSRSGEQVTLDLGDFVKTVGELYEDVLPRVISGVLPIREDSRVVSFEAPNDQTLVEFVKSEISAAIQREVESQMTYHQDINFTYNCEFSRNDVIFVLVLVYSKLKSGEEYVSLHDYLTPSPMLESFKR